MPLKYGSGEVVMKGDRVLLSKEAGVIEFVADPLNNDPITLWYVKECGAGVVISQLKSLGSVFTHPEEDSDVKFVCRDTSQAVEESGGPPVADGTDPGSK
jgi:hypothetical protein